MEQHSKFREYLKYRPLGPVGTFIGMIIGTPVIVFVAFFLLLAIGTFLNRIGIGISDPYALIILTIFSLGSGVVFIVYQTRKDKKIYIPIAGILGLVFGFILVSSISVDSGINRSSARRDSRRITDINQIRLALEIYFDENGPYPDELSKLPPKSIERVPIDPTTQKPYFYVEYKTDDNKSHYHLGANLDTENISILATDKDSNIGFDGADSKGCGGEKKKYCYDITSD